MPRWKRPLNQRSTTFLRGTDHFDPARESRSANLGLEQALLEFGALARAEAEALPEIAFEIAILGVDRIEAGREERRLHRSDRLPHVGGQVGCGIGIAAVEAVGEEIVL